MDSCENMNNVFFFTIDRFRINGQSSVKIYFYSQKKKHYILVCTTSTRNIVCSFKIRSILLIFPVFGVHIMHSFYMYSGVVA